MRAMNLPERVLRYGVAGAGTSIAYTSLVIFILHLRPRMAPTEAAVLAYLLAQPVGFLLHGTLTYPGTLKARIRLLHIGFRFLLTNSAGFCLSTGGMALVTMVWHGSYLWGLLLTWILIPAMNFVIYLAWVFRRAQPEQG